MKMTVGIPDREIADAMRFTQARTPREAIVNAIMEFNRRRRIAALARHAGTLNSFMAPADARRLRRRRQD